jgi:hypothetical protein
MLFDAILVVMQGPLAACQFIEQLGSSSTGDELS